MTILGKILVFLVFVAALAMGGLMVFVSKTSPDWTAAVKERDTAIGVYKAMLDQEADSRKKLIRENEQMKKLLDANLIESRGGLERARLEAKDKAEQAAKAQSQQEKSDLLHKQAQAQAKALHDENDFMRTTLAAREETINKQLKELEAARAEVQSAKNEADAAKNRSQTLYDQLKEKELFIRNHEKENQAVRVAATGATKDATYANPPQVYVKGKVESVDAEDKTLVKISVGSDQGVRKGNTMEVFRYSPKAEYLGRLVVEDAQPHWAICRLLRQPGYAPPPALQKDDEVASKLRP